METLRPLVPAGLEIDTFEGSGFVTVAMVWTKKLRPAAFPAFLGQDFFLAGYRIFTRLTDDGRCLRGLQILRSETDRRRMVWLGNLMTHYHYRHVAVRIRESAEGIRVETARADSSPSLDLTFSPEDAAPPLPKGSPFAEWRDARRFAGPMPFTFSEESAGRFVVIEGSRQAWTPQPVAVHTWQVGLFAEAPFGGTKPILASAFSVKDVAYRWRRGRIVRTGDRAG